MATGTGIEWTDATWNPTSGCTRASPGCDHCYAVKQTYRLDRMGQTAKYGGLTVLNPKGDRHFNGVLRTHEAALPIPLRWTKPRRVFVNSMSDLFHPGAPFDFVDRVFAVMALTPQHTYQILTKRPERMAEYLRWEEPSRTREGAVRHQADVLLARAHRINERNKLWKGWPLPNVWLGTSVEDQKRADERIPHLLRCPAAVRFLSCEPLLGPVDLAVLRPCTEHFSFGKLYDHGDDECPFPAINWVIVGGESGPKARPMHPYWPQSLRDQSQAAGVAFFFKQWGSWASLDLGEGRVGDTIIYPDGRTEPYPKDRIIRAHGYAMRSAGKKAAGRLLDGREWSEFPAATVPAHHGKGAAATA